MGFADEDGKVVKPSLQGGIVAMYYMGALLGAFWAGALSDSYGRIKGIWMACFWCLAGVILQASAQNLAHMLCARIVAGVGVAFIIVIAPSWTAELPPAAHRGKMISLTFWPTLEGSLCLPGSALAPRSPRTRAERSDGDSSLRVRPSPSCS